MEIFHVGDKVFLDNIRGYKYGKVMAVDIEDNLMVISPIINDNAIISVHIDSSYVHKVNFFPKDHVIIHDLLKDYCDKRGVVAAYSWQIDRYRVMINNEPHWFAPFELTLADESEHFVTLFSSSNPIKVTLSDEGKKAYKYHFGVEPPVDTNGRTEFANLAQLMEVYDPTFTYCDKYMLEDDEILVKAVD